MNDLGFQLIQSGSYLFDTRECCLCDFRTVSWIAWIRATVDTWLIFALSSDRRVVCRLKIASGHGILLGLIRGDFVQVEGVLKFVHPIYPTGLRLLGPSRIEVWIFLQHLEC